MFNLSSFFGVNEVNQFSMQITNTLQTQNTFVTVYMYLNFFAVILLTERVAV
jgi:hypothetical protein